MTTKMPLPVSFCYVGVCRSFMQMLIYHSLWNAPNFSQWWHRNTQGFICFLRNAAVWSTEQAFRRRIFFKKHNNKIQELNNIFFRGGGRVDLIPDGGLCIHTALNLKLRTRDNLILSIKTLGDFSLHSDSTYYWDMQEDFIWENK